MSRGSYQRRVYITVLQHNDGYAWQDEYMHMFTGENPGFFMRKMIQERRKAFLRTKKTRSKPGFSRRKTVQYVEEEHDYGEEAVVAAEQRMNDPFDITKIELKYAVSIFL